jgi:hypothetical protein
MHPQTQLSRCFIQPIEEPAEQKVGGGDRKHRDRQWHEEMIPGILNVLRPWAHQSLVFDVETTTDAHSGQQARILFWQEHGLRYVERCALFAEVLLTPELMDLCWSEGVAYNTYAARRNSNGSRTMRPSIICGV